MTKTTQNDTARPSFEEALERLEKIVVEIEQGRIPLETSIERYAEGIELIEQCRSILDKAEEKIQLLQKSGKAKLSAAGELDDADADDDEA